MNFYKQIYGIIIVTCVGQGIFAQQAPNRRELINKRAQIEANRNNVDTLRQIRAVIEQERHQIRNNI